MENVFLSILGNTISVGLIVIVLFLLTPFFNKRYAAKWKYFIWIFLALWLLVPFSSVARPFSRDTLPQTGQIAGSENVPAHTAIPYRRIVVEIPAQMTTPMKARPEKNIAGITMFDIAAFVWIIGSLIFISVHLISYFLYKRQVMRHGRILKDGQIVSHMLEIKRELHIRRAVCMMESYEAESPMIIGFFKPVMVLPKEQYSSEEMYFILKHELVHLKRGDVYLKLLFITANAVHWFNPLIWIMQKEAVIDMELSCDERVTQGTDYAVRKAYTETLLSMLHKQCTRRTVLSTQFYGGKKIMKKRFKNILMKKGKKNGISILICAIVLTISFGTMIGCSLTKKDAGNEHIGNEGTEYVSRQPKRETVQTEPMHTDNSFTEDPTLKNTTMLTFSKEGEQEQKPSTLAAGDGYSIYLPDDEGWHLSGPDLWTTDFNEEIALWITHFEGESMDSVDQKLEGEGYAKEDHHTWLKQEGDRIVHVEQKTFENDVWGIYYSYPADFEEGWGRELPVIANTFALSSGTDDTKDESSDEAGEYLEAEDCQKIKTVLDAFAAAYFHGDADAIHKFLASTYEGKIDTYAGTGTISALTVKGLSAADEKKIENGRCTASLEFRDSNYEDMFLYLTFILAKEENDWKIEFYGVEG